jgi:hypothetical protein
MLARSALPRALRPCSSSAAPWIAESGFQLVRQGLRHALISFFLDRHAHLLEGAAQ